MTLRELAVLLDNLERDDHAMVHEFLLKQIAKGVTEYQRAIQELAKTNYDLTSQYLAADQTHLVLGEAMSEQRERMAGRFDTIIQKADSK